MSPQTIQIAFCQRTVTTSLSLSSICTFTRSHHPLCVFVPRRNTRRHQWECFRLPRNALADASNVGENHCLEHPLGHGDGIRAVQQTRNLRDPHLLENVESKSAPSNDASFMAENSVSDMLTAQNKICLLKGSWTTQHKKLSNTHVSTVSRSCVQCPLSLCRVPSREREQMCSWFRILVSHSTVRISC